MKIYLAEVDSRHFNFKGFGINRAEALATLRDALGRHAAQCSIQHTNFVSEMMLDPQVTVYRTKKHYRDNEEF